MSKKTLSQLKRLARRGIRSVSDHDLTVENRAACLRARVAAVLLRRGGRWSAPSLSWARLGPLSGLAGFCRCCCGWLRRLAAFRALLGPPAAGALALGPFSGARSLALFSFSVPMCVRGGFSFSLSRSRLVA